MPLTTTKIVPHLSKILQHIPAEWRGTTFNNSNLLGRSKFCANLMELVAKGSDAITHDSLYALGNAEDYLRVSTNISTLLELVLAQEMDLDVHSVFTFASHTMGVVAVAKSTGKKVHLFLGEQKPMFTSDDLKILALVDCNIEFHSGEPTEPKTGVVLCLKSVYQHKFRNSVDAILGEHELLIINNSVISPDQVLVIRKRMATPVTTPMAEQKLQKLASVTVTANIQAADDRATKEMYAHLQELSGTDVNPNAHPVCFTAGLPSIAALWITLISRGGADILMASTAYGGSSQLTDLLSTATETHTPQLKKHKFHIQGASEMVASIKSSLDKLATMKDSLFPTTVLFIEIPTNPDMKVPEIEKLALLLSDYEKITGKKVLLLVDSTFAPGSKIMLKLKSLVPDLNVMVFISLSKSVSRGITTAGCLVANHTPLGISLIKNVDQISKIMDTRAKPDQILALVQHHVGVEKRCLDAYNVAKVAGSVLVESVKSLTGHDLQLAFVKPHQAEIGFTTSTFSFNLPSPKNATQEILQGLAQRFTDLLCENKVFKPCVSFGQDNGLVYCTVPATSTQGAISEEDKAQQAIGGVQLVRLSFPPTCEIEVVKKVIAQSVSSIYS